MNFRPAIAIIIEIIIAGINRIGFGLKKKV
jgi:hypothetical protein